MLVDPNLKDDQRDAASRQDESIAMLELSRRGKIVLLVVAAVLCFSAYRLFVASPSHYRAGEVIEKAATVLRTGDQVTVPEGSPVRGRLAIAPVAVKDIKRDIVLPAVVEADPGRTVNVLPPVAGRVVSLAVQLGERVTQGQELLVLDSGDLAQAFSDDEKARAMLSLTKQVLDRQLGLEKAGGAAIKDREQAQSDYAQAQSEFERAETRLRSIGVSADQTQKTRLLSMKAPMAGSVIDLRSRPAPSWNDTTAALMTIADLAHDLGDGERAGKGHGAGFQGAVGRRRFHRLSRRGVQRPGAVRQRRARSRHAPHQGPHRLRQSRHATAAGHVRQCQLLRAGAERAGGADQRAGAQGRCSIRCSSKRRRGRSRRAPSISAFQQGDQVVLTSGVKAGDRVVVKGGVLLGD